MARIVFNPLVESIHGRIGNLVVQDVFGTQTVRRWVEPRQPRTELQQSVRRDLTLGVRAWAYMPDTIREAWRSWALLFDRLARPAAIAEWTRVAKIAKLTDDILFVPHSDEIVDVVTFGVPTVGVGSATVVTEILERPLGWVPRRVVALLTSDVQLSENLYLYPSYWSGVDLPLTGATNFTFQIPYPASNAGGNNFLLDGVIIYQDSDGLTQYGYVHSGFAEVPTLE